MSSNQSSSSTIQSILGIILILFGCCLNVISLELLATNLSGIGSLLTTAQFLFIILVNLPILFTKREIPLLRYIGLTIMFYLSSLLNNSALNYSISIPIHTIFRSSSLVSTLVIGLVGYKKKYSSKQIISCIIVSLGVIIVTLADSSTVQLSAKKQSCCESSIGHSSTISNISTQSVAEDCEAEDYSRWLLGIIILVVALLLGSFMGHEQEKTFQFYGKHVWKELMFWSHALSLPGMLFSYNEIHSKFLELLAAKPLTILNWEVSLLWVLVANILLQAVCIRGVYITTSNTNILTNTLVITGRKCLSLLFSIYFFNNPFSRQHSLGASLVFLGVINYSLDINWGKFFGKTAETRKEMHIESEKLIEKAESSSAPASPSSSPNIALSPTTGYQLRHRKQNHSK
jgi:UDP-xylose/UDP-N-acetylglucosamine transporter B4